jgi:uncharacterized protein (DUF1786 family)
MRALAVDIGTGTQDVLLFDSDREIENAFRLVLPSPTALVAERIRRATMAGAPVVLRGPTMGGGPSHWAARDHAVAGLPIAASESAARTFDDDLDAVRAMGIQVLDDAAIADLARRPDSSIVNTGDIRLDAISGALAPFAIELGTIDAMVIAVFDHGAAPPGVSDRRFRFARLAERLLVEPAAGPAAFAYLAEGIPEAFTRLRAAAGSAHEWLAVSGWGHSEPAPVLAIDTGPAAVLGMLDDEAVRSALDEGRPVVAVNVGNFHALAMRLSLGDGGAPRIDGIVEHHTGELDGAALSELVSRLADGTVDDETVFRSMGHGALMRDTWTPDGQRPLVAVTGPRRAMLVGREVAGSGRPHPAVPHGDMMQTGNFGGIRALAHRLPAWRATVEHRLGPAIRAAAHDPFTDKPPVPVPVSIPVPGGADT